MKKCNTELMKDLKAIKELIVSAIEWEQRNSTMTYGEGDRETIPNEYDYARSTQELASLQQQERTIKARLAVSNATTKVDGYDMTIAEALVYLAQLSQNKDRLVRLANREKLVRGSTSRYSSNTEYTKACYDIAKAKEDLAKLNQAIANLQMAIDRTNLTNLIDVD